MENKAKPILVITYTTPLKRAYYYAFKERLSNMVDNTGWAVLLLDGMDRNEVIAFMPDKDSGMMSLPELVEHIQKGDKINAPHRGEAKK